VRARARALNSHASAGRLLKCECVTLGWITGWPNWCFGLLGESGVLVLLM
jgi:hypothetical protein